MDKEKRNKRFIQKDRHIKRELGILAKCSFPQDHNYYIQPHRLHKKHATNCGNPRCLVCSNPRKIWGQKTLKEYQFECEEINNG